MVEDKPIKTVDTGYLIKSGRDIRTPFRLAVPKPGTGIVEVEFVEILRLLPQKRIVARARVNGMPILVKTFLGRTANRDASREIEGVKAISSAGVRTTDLLWEADLSENGRLLAFEYLPDASSLNQLWRTLDEDAQRTEILSRVMSIMSRLHSKGVIQQDIHLANFLLSGGEIHTIDGGGILCRSAAPLGESASIMNLALLFAQFLARYDCLVPGALAEYVKTRDWPGNPDRLGTLQTEIERCRGIRMREHIDKAFRDCTRFVCDSSFRRFVVCERRAYGSEMQGLIAHLDQAMVRGRTLKRGNSATVALVHLGGRALVIKRYNIKGLFHGVRRALQKSRAWVSWSNAHRMEFLGIPALKPVALIEDRLGPLRRRAYLITEYIEGPDALDCVRSVADPCGELTGLADIIQELSESQISHGDLKATNFLMAEGGPVIIDLDGMQEHRTRDSFERAFKGDLERFMSNWDDSPRLSDHFAALLSDLNHKYGVNTPATGTKG